MPFLFIKGILVIQCVLSGLLLYSVFSERPAILFFMWLHLLFFSLFSLFLCVPSSLKSSSVCVWSPLFLLLLFLHGKFTVPSFFCDDFTFCSSLFSLFPFLCSLGFQWEQWHQHHLKHLSHLNNVILNTFRTLINKLFWVLIFDVSDK